MGRLLLALAVLAALASPATAVALPGDAAFAPLDPPDGAALPVDPNGIRVTYTCPCTGSPTRACRCSEGRRTTA
jgi:hypothetical protein